MCSYAHTATDKALAGDKGAIDAIVKLLHANINDPGVCENSFRALLNLVPCGNHIQELLYVYTH